MASRVPKLNNSNDSVRKKIELKEKTQVWILRSLEPSTYSEKVSANSRSKVRWRLAKLSLIGANNEKTTSLAENSPLLKHVVLARIWSRRSSKTSWEWNQLWRREIQQLEGHLLIQTTKKSSLIKEFPSFLFGLIGTKNKVVRIDEFKVGCQRFNGFFDRWRVFHLELSLFLGTSWWEIDFEWDGHECWLMESECEEKQSIRFLGLEIFNIK